MPALYPHSALLPRADDNTTPRLEPNSTQRTTIIVACAYVVAIALLSWLPVVNWIFYPFRLLAVGFHEFSHAFMGILTCAKIEGIELDPYEGGVTRMRGGINWLTLPAGYLGSSLVGAALIACGFDEKASKVASIVVGVFFLCTLWWARRDWFTWLLVIIWVGLFIAFWLIKESVALRYFVLFVGVHNCLYCIWDICDDLVFRKVNESDASAFAKRYGGSSQCHGFLWLLISIGFFACGILVGLAAFKQSQSEQTADPFLKVDV